MCKWFFPVVLTILLSGCAASGPMFANAPHLSQGESGVYVYRTKHMLAGKGLAAKVYVDGKPLGKLRDNGYLYQKLSPGAHTIGVESGATLFKKVILRKQIFVKSNSVAYIKLEWEANGGSQMYSGNLMLPTNDWRFYEIPKAVANHELPTLRYSM